MSSPIGTVQAIFQADTKSFDASVKASSNQLNAAAFAAERAGGAISAAGGKIDRTAQLQEKAVDRARVAWQREIVEQQRAAAAQAETGRAQELAALRADILTRSTDRQAIAQRRLNLLQEGGRNLLGGLGAIGIGVGITAAVEGFRRMVEQTVETGVQLGKLHEQTGVSVEDLSVLKFAAQSTGVEFETLTRGFKRLAVTVYDADNGNKVAVKGFTQLGISVAQLRAKGDDMYGILGMIADKFQQLPDGIAKSDAAAKIFGARMGSELIPVLNGGSAALEKLKAEAPIFTDADVAQMEKMHQSVNDLDAAWRKLSLTLTSTAAPALEAIMKQIPQVFGVGGQGKYGNDWVAGLQAIREAAHDASLEMSKVGLLSIGDFEGAKQIDIDDAKQRHAQWAEAQKAAAAGGPKALPRSLVTSGEDSDAMTINPSEIFNQNVERQTKNQDDLKAFYNSLDNAKALAAQTTSLNIFDPIAQVQTNRAMPDFQLPQFGLPQASQLSIALGDLRDSIGKTADEFGDLGRQLSGVFTKGLNDFNSTLIKVLGTPRSMLAGTHVWRGLGANVARSAGMSALQFGEGAVMHGLGFGSHADGSAAAPFWVRNADTRGGGAPGIPGAGSGLLGVMNNSNFFGSLFGGKLFGPGGIFDQGAGAGGGAGAGVASSAASGGVGVASAVLGSLMHFAGGGMIPSNMPVMVGERGPEILAGAGGRSVIPNDAIGGAPQIFIDARGNNDHAATEAAVHRAMSGYMRQMPGASRASIVDYNRRVPRSARV